MAFTIPDISLNFAGNEAISIDNTTPASLCAPAMAMYSGNLYVLFSGADTTAPSIWQMTYNATDGWAGNTSVSYLNGGAPLTLSTPGLAELDGTLYMAYIQQPYDTNTNGYIQVASLTAAAGDTSPLSSTSWVFLQPPNGPVADAGGLAMLAVQNRLWIFYNSGDQLCLAVGKPAASGFTWESYGALPVTASMLGAPSAAWLINTKATSDKVPKYPMVFIHAKGQDDYCQYVLCDVVNNEFYPPHNVVSAGKNTTHVRSELSPSITPLVDGVAGALLFKGEQGESINISLYLNGSFYGTYAIETISAHVGSTKINPTTVYGVAAAVTAEGQLMMVYPSALSDKNMDLYWATATLSTSS